MGAEMFCIVGIILDLFLSEALHSKSPKNQNYKMKA
jgi:hypothetical protein